MQQKPYSRKLPQLIDELIHEKGEHWLLNATTQQVKDALPEVAENDKYRDERLQDLGYTVLRLENQDVFKLTEWVEDEIKKCFK
ncbi:MAG: DUF559 domain-containing protein [Chitinophagales bacterium]|nr:DUF559 domain-containing protein [Chitinophagaceae bacterium]MCB9066143.1 DUF559 domain-containing protein [Chitinophagales bacterium]